MKLVKQCVSWMRSNRTIVVVGLAVILVMGLTGVVRFPAVVSVSRAVHCVPDEADGRAIANAIYEVAERCGIPVDIANFCITELPPEDI